MGDYVLKLKGNEMALSSANTVGNADLVRLLNTSTGIAVITQTSNAAVQVGNCSILANQELFFQKLPTDTLASTNNLVLATSVSFRD